MRSHAAKGSQLAASRRLQRHCALRVRAQNNNKNSLDDLKEFVARRPAAQKAVLRLLLSPGLTGTLAVAGSYLANMSSPLSALLTPPTASDIAIGLAAAVPLVALDALMLGPNSQPETPPKRLGGSLPMSSSPPVEKDEPQGEERGSSSTTATTATTSGGGEEEEEEGGSVAAKEAEEEEESRGEEPKKAKGPDAATVEAGRLALLRSLSASGVAVFDAGALAAGPSPSVGGFGGESKTPQLRRRLRAAAHAYSSRAVRSTLAREIPGSPLAEAALVASARAGTELLARFFALRFAGAWVADRVVEAGGLVGEDALVALLSWSRAPPDAPLGTAGEVLVLAATAAGLAGIGVAGVVAAEAEAARAAAEVERRTRGSKSSSGTGEAAAAAAEPTSTSARAAAAAAAATAAALERGGLAVMQQISRARADAALLDASLDALRLLVVGGAFVASGNHVAASFLATTVRELPRRWLVMRSAARATRVRQEAREEFERLVSGDEKFLALRRAMEERREKRVTWLKRREELMGGGGGGGGAKRESGEGEGEGDGRESEGKDEV